MKRKQIVRRNWTFGFICASPIIISLEIFIFSEITSLLRDQSDISVIIGCALISCLIIGNIGLITLIKYKSIKK